MTPFSIICNSCAARLKVSKASAVNQLLACPKCGEMIRVTPPAGWIPPEPVKSNSSDSLSNADIPSPQSDDPFIGDFDDIDKILSKPQQPGRPVAAQPNPTTKPLETVPTPTPRRKKRKLAAASAATAVATQSTPSAEANSDPDQPVLPNDDWQSDDTRQRKRWVTTFVLCLGAMLLIGAGVVAVMMNLQKPDPAVAKNDDSQEVNQASADDEKKIVEVKNQDDEASPLDGVGQENNEDGDNELINDNGEQFNGGNPNLRGDGKIMRDPAGMQRVDTDLNNADIKMPEPRPGIAGELIPNVVPNQPAPILQNPAGDQPDQNPIADLEIENPQPKFNGIGPAPVAPINPPPHGNGNGNNDPPKPAIGISPLEPPQLPDGGGLQLPFPNGNQPAKLNLAPEPARKKPGIAQLEKMNSKIGDLASLLEDANTSMTELRDVADQMTGHSPAGLPKYVVDKPDEIKPNLEKLKLNVGGLLYDRAPLSQISRDLATISGVPFTIDARSIAMTGKNPNQPISAKIEDVLLEAAINELLNPNGLTYRQDSVGFTIGVMNSKEFKTAKYPVPNIPDLDDVGKQKFLAYVQGLIQPSLWVRDQNPATIKLDGENIVVDCPDDCHAEVSLLLRKLKSSFALIADPIDAAALKDTQTRTYSILGNFENKIEYKKTIQTPIGSFLNKLEKRTGVAVLVDWENVMKEGWTPQTLIPGNIDEPTVQEVIRQIAMSMDLTLYAINSNTVVMTTHTQAAETRDIEVYPVSKLLAGKLDETFLLEVFETALGNQLRSERYIYAPNCQCFIVSAPQSKQRQVEALLKRLEGI